MGQIDIIISIKEASQRKKSQSDGPGRRERAGQYLTQKISQTFCMLSCGLLFSTPRVKVAVDERQVQASAAPEPESKAQIPTYRPTTRRGFRNEESADPDHTDDDNILADFTQAFQTHFDITCTATNVQVDGPVVSNLKEAPVSQSMGNEAVKVNHNLDGGGLATASYRPSNSRSRTGIMRGEPRRVKYRVSIQLPIIEEERSDE